jgi:hypothetical protein
MVMRVTVMVSMKARMRTHMEVRMWMTVKKRGSNVGAQLSVYPLLFNFPLVSNIVLGKKNKLISLIFQFLLKL